MLGAEYWGCPKVAMCHGVNFHAALALGKLWQHLYLTNLADGRQNTKFLVRFAKPCARSRIRIAFAIL